MTFNQLFSNFQTKYGNNHDVVFFELLFSCSRLVNNKERFATYHNNDIDFKEKKFIKLCKEYFQKEKPLAHITSHTTFCGLDFKVSKKVLAPREVTEQMVNDFIAKHKNDPSSQVLDLCCGCGCIGISIKKYIPQFFIVCIDKYWGPIFDTHDNGVKHKTALTVDCKDVFDYLNTKGRTDFIVSNPPYINANNFSNKKMFKWENKKALIAPDNGLYFYKKYFDWLDKHTFKEAWFEIGFDLVAPLKQIATTHPTLDIEFVKDRQYIIVKRKQ